MSWARTAANTVVGALVFGALATVPILLLQMQRSERIMTVEIVSHSGLTDTYTSANFALDTAAGTVTVYGTNDQGIVGEWIYMLHGVLRIGKW